MEEVIQAESSAPEKTIVSERSKSHPKKKVKEKTGKGAKFREKFDDESEEKSVNGVQKTVAEIVTGKGLSVPMCDGEEVVSLFILDVKFNFSLIFSKSQKIFSLNF